MTKEIIKPFIPFIGIPVLAILLLVVRFHNLETIRLMQSELLLIIGYIIAVKDVRERQIPNEIVLALLACWILTIIPQIVMDTEYALWLLRDAAFGFAIGGGLFLLVYLVSRRGLGGGDVKFMAVAGLYLGLNGVLPAMLYGSVLAALFCLTLILLKRIDRKGEIPLAPFLYVGIIITIFFYTGVFQ